MDGVLFDFNAAVNAQNERTLIDYTDRIDEIPNIFRALKPIKDAISSINILAKHFDVYVLSTAPWNHPQSMVDKLASIKKYFSQIFYKRLILTHHKNLNRGDFLIDDRRSNGAEDFEGEHIHFGTDKFPDWKCVTEYLLTKI